MVLMMCLVAICLPAEADYLPHDPTISRTHRRGLQGLRSALRSSITDVWLIVGDDDDDDDDASELGNVSDFTS